MKAWLSNLFVFSTVSVSNGVHMLETGVFKFNFITFESRATSLYILLKLLQFTLNKLLFSAVKMIYVSVQLRCIYTDWNFDLVSIIGHCV